LVTTVSRRYQLRAIAVAPSTMQVDSRREFDAGAGDATVPKATIDVVQAMHMHTLRHFTR
jgi:hypothetical protein